MTYTLEQQQAMANAAARQRAAQAQGVGVQDAPAPASAAQPPPAAAPAPEPQGQSALQMLNAGAQNFSQGVTMGWGNRIGAQIAKPLIYLAENGPLDKNVSYGHISDQVDAAVPRVTKDATDFNREHPWIGGAEQMAGGAASAIAGAGGVVAKTAGKIAPNAAKALSAWAEESPYWAASATGAGAGGIYGAGSEGSPEDRGLAALGGAAGGAVVGPAALAVGRNIISPLAKKAGGALSDLSDFLTSKESEMPEGASTAAEASAAARAAPEQPQGAPQAPAAQGPASLTGKLPLSPGVQAKDPNMLRVEEEARQGQIGRDAQLQMNQSDQGVSQAARDVIQQLKGAGNTGEAKDQLAATVETFQEAGSKVKSDAQALYKQRDAMMADAVLNKQKVGPSLGAKLSDVVTDPSNAAGFKSKSGGPAKALYDDFKTLVAGGGDKALPFSDLAAWRQDVASLATTDQSTAGTMAKRLGMAYDNWMDGMTQDQFLSGDPGVASKAREAASAWKNYKDLYTSKNTPLIEGMSSKPFDKTPRDFVDQVFGASIKGTNSTALIVRKMANALPAEDQQGFTDNVFKGLVSKAFEGAGDADKLSLAKLRNNLSDLVGSDVYKESLSNQERDTVINNLVKDLDQHITQIGRADVRSPSGGAILRGIQSLVGHVADIPVVGKVSGAKVADTLMNKAGDLNQSSMDRKAFNTAMKAAAKGALGMGKQGAVFNPMPAAMGGIAAGATAQMAMQPDQPQGAQ